MKKYTIWIAVTLIIALVALMVKDFYYQETAAPTNPYDYNMNNLRKVDESLISYKELSPLQFEDADLKALCISSKDELLVSSANKIMVYDTDLKLKSDFMASEKVYCLHKGESGKVYVGLEKNVEVYSLEGELEKTWEVQNDKSYLTSIAEKQDLVYVADAGAKMVYQYNTNGEFQKNIGEKDTLNGIPHYVIPSPFFDLLIGRQGELWVVNPGLHAFQAFNENGELYSSWEKTSMQVEGFSGCCNPSNIAMLSDGSFVTSEKGIERIKIHSPNGEFKTIVASPESFDEGVKGLDLAVDSQDRIYVLDPKRGQVRIFEKKN